MPFSFIIPPAPFELEYASHLLKSVAPPLALMYSSRIGALSRRPTVIATWETSSQQTVSNAFSLWLSAYSPEIA
jgi:hypothetical protein